MSNISQNCALNRPLSTFKRRRFLWLFIIAVAYLFAQHPVDVRAQDDPLQGIGVPPFSVQQPAESGYVNLADADLHVQIPLASLPQRAGGKFDVSLMYDSNIWVPGYTWSYLGTYFSGTPLYNSSSGFPYLYGFPAGWRIVTSADWGQVDYNDEPGTICWLDGQDEWDNFAGWIYYAPDGTSHSFGGYESTQGYVTACGDSTSMSSGFTAIAADATGYELVVSDGSNVVLYGRDGSSLAGPIEDSNGNSFDPFTLADNLGRQVVTTSVTGNTITYGVLNSQGTRSNYVVTMSTIPVHTNFGVTGLTEYSTSSNFYVVDSISLPDGTSYSFGYDSGTAAGHYGQMTSMFLPTTGEITYTYQNFVDASSYATYWSMPTRELHTRTTPDGEWTYTPLVNHACTTYPFLDCQENLTVTKPSGDTAVYTFVLGGAAWPTQVQYYSGSTTLLATTTQCFSFVTVTNGSCSYSSAPEVTGSGVEKLADTTTLTSATTPSRTSVYAWDVWGDMTSKKEWNFGSSTSGNPDRTTTTSYLGGTSYSAVNIANRPASVIVTDSSGNPVAKTVNCYDYAGGCGGSSFASATATQHDNSLFPATNTVRGDLTYMQRYITSSTYLATSMTYDMTGQVISSTDPYGNTTNFDYTDNFFDESGDGSNPGSHSLSGATNAYVKTITHPTVNSVTLIDTLGYYWGTSQKALYSDPNSQTTYFHFNDLMNRPTSVKSPIQYGSSCCGWTYNVYPSDSENQVDTGIGITSTTRSISCTPSTGDCRHDQTHLDGLGRVYKQILESDPDCTSGTEVDTTYDLNGRIYSVSNPYCSTSDSTYGVTTYGYDGLDRITQITRADSGVEYTYYGSDVSSHGGLSSQLCSGYGVGYPILTVDEASKVRQTWIDGFGRLIEADEPNSSGSLSSGVSTCYGYDLNNNLTAVAQGSQTRSFSYDMLSRLTAAANPESGTTSYSYTISGGSPCSGDVSTVCSRTDANGLVTTYCYDALNRLTGKKYAAASCPLSSPDVTYLYDQSSYNGLTITYGKGNRTGMTDATGQTAWSYDQVGNSLGVKRTTNSVSDPITYTYNLDSTQATVVYPSGRTITYAPGGAQRPLSAKDLTNSINYATGVAYAAFGGLKSVQNGAYLLSTYYYNKRLQPCRVAINSSGTAPSSCSDSGHTGNVMDFAYNFNVSSSDNGNVLGLSNNIDNTRSQTFTYDSLNRIATAAASNYATSPAHCWGESFTIDRYGNLSGIGSISSAYNGCIQENLSLSISTSTNRITTTGFTYDSAGRQTSDGMFSPSYDAEGHITSDAGVTYSYDGDGKRVEKSYGGAVYKIYWYGTNADPLSESDGSGNVTDEYIFLGGKRIARRKVQ